MSATYEAKQTLLFGVAKLALVANGDVSTLDSIDIEMARLERIIEQYYVQANEEYNKFVIRFLRDNFDEIVHGDAFLGDVEIEGKPDEEKYYI